MTKVMSLQQALKFFLSLILALVALYAGAALSDRLVASQSAGLRWLGVPPRSSACFRGSASSSYRSHTSTNRRIVLVGTAAAFVVDAIVHIAFNVIVDAHLVSPTSHLPTLPIAMGIWVLGVAATLLYYRATL